MAHVNYTVSDCDWVTCQSCVMHDVIAGGGGAGSWVRRWEEL